MSQRIECSRRACRWTGTYLTAGKRQDDIWVTDICPSCGCDSFYALPEPIITERVEHANALIKVIASHGHKFFEHKGAIATMELDKNGKVWLVDEYTKARIYTHNRREWKGFNHGGTSRDLVCAMRDYITKGKQLPIAWIAPIRINPEHGDIWGYGTEARTAAREAAAKLPIIDAGEQA
jgi:ribosomal protein L16/L10AE